MKIITNQNQILDSEVSFEIIESKLGLNFHSRGGAKNTEQTRNLDYFLGVETIINRQKKQNVEFINFYINSSKSKSIWPNLKDRQLKIDNNFNIILSNYSTEELRIQISKELANKKENNQTKGGNPTKRFYLTVPNLEFDWKLIIRPNKESIIEDIEGDIQIEVFNPENIQDANEKTLVSITKRRGQNIFRKKLLKLYNNKCAITESNVIQILQAAHIVPYMGEYTNHLTNGIILRSDIHDLFDLNLISIDENYKVIISPLLKETEYEKYNNKEIYLPEAIESRPNIKALKTKPKPYRE